VRDGYDRANTGLIAAAAGVSIGTVYQYFPNKDAIFSELLKAQLDAVLEGTMSALAKVPGGDLAAHVRAAVGAILATKAKNPRLHRALKTQLGRLDGDRLVQALRARSLEMTQAMLVVHAGELRVADPERAAFFVVHAVEGVVDGLLVDAPESLGDPAIAESIAGMVTGFLCGGR
jgi:AcrR family transcriptional regulator